MAGRGHKDNLGIGRVDRDAIDGLSLLKPQMGPSLASVACAPDAVSNGRTLPVVGLAGSDIDDVRVGRGNPDGSNRLVLHVVELGVPVVSAIGRFPEAPGG